mmetsp:Transcript_2219/g.6469  ORF Transcript_2219/g.6469 Transcript_2219/m.6469 type:complete len:89 (-) Transcript_2219:725-991(-)
METHETRRCEDDRTADSLQYRCTRQLRRDIDESICLAKTVLCETSRWLEGYGRLSLHVRLPLLFLTTSFSAKQIVRADRHPNISAGGS